MPVSAERDESRFVGLEFFIPAIFWRSIVLCLTRQPG